MKNRNYPIVLGHRFKKGFLALKQDGEWALLICRLKKWYKTGERFAPTDIENVEVELLICDKGTLETMISVLQEVSEQWDEG